MNYLWIWIYAYVSAVIYICAHEHTYLLRSTRYTYNFNTMLQLIEAFQAFKWSICKNLCCKKCSVCQVFIYIIWDEANVLIWHVYFIPAGLIRELWKLASLWSLQFTLFFIAWHCPLFEGEFHWNYLPFKILWQLRKMYCYFFKLWQLYKIPLSDWNDSSHNYPWLWCSGKVTNSVCFEDLLSPKFVFLSF